MKSKNGKSPFCLIALLFALQIPASAQQSVESEPSSDPNVKGISTADSDELTLNQLKASGSRQADGHQRSDDPSSGTLFDLKQHPDSGKAPEPQLDIFQKRIAPILQRTCVPCHGPDQEEGNIRIDTLDPNLVQGEDVPWWLEVFAVLSNSEMPPPDETELSDGDRNEVIDWLSTEIQTASAVRRSSQEFSSFRRMTRYEYNYALQDLLGLPHDFAKDLPPEPSSEHGFQNSSEILHMSVMQFELYRELARKALQTAIVRGEQPQPLYWGITMQQAAASYWETQESALEKIRQEHQGDPEKLTQQLQRKIASFQARHSRAHYRNGINGRTAVANWRYAGAKYAHKPSSTRPETPDSSKCVAVIPPKQRLIVELGDRIPEKGTLRVRFRASRSSTENVSIPSLQLEFGWQASNDSQATVRISDHEILVDAPPGSPKFYQWDIPLGDIYPRNTVRKVNNLGDLPSPSEYLKFANSTASQGDVQIDYIEVTAPVYDTWPPASHARIFINHDGQSPESRDAKDILSNFMHRAWRRPVTTDEIEQKISLFTKIRPQCDDFQEAIIEVLATVLSSPKFLYLSQSNRKDNDGNSKENQSRHNRRPPALTEHELATRMAVFLWCSTPDQQLLDLAQDGKLRDPAILDSEVERMLTDVRSHRFAKHFVRQWLDMQLLDYLQVDRKDYPQFDPTLKEAMQEEPIAFFYEVLQQNHSILDFLHADYTMANERLAQHYGLEDVFGNEFRRVELDPADQRGGLLTQAGLLAMNSDGKDSHPLKRGIWLLENLLDDPPPPPPPAVPEIDIADPAIAKLTLKQRMEDHRKQAACRSCHMKIDPWGIALENFDAIGSWRTHVQGEVVDASGILFNRQRLDGVDGLKRFLLTNRQDQFTRAMVVKLTGYALGRPLRFADRAEIDLITANLRQQGGGLVTLIKLIVKCDLFRTE
ncbi:MAG: DUF1592 domain-containing protein [Rubripirellula sp.]